MRRGDSWKCEDPTFDGTSIAFGGAPIPLPNGSTSTDLFVVKLDPTFGLLKQADGHASSGDTLYSVATDAAGSLLLRHHCTKFVLLRAGGAENGERAAEHAR